MYPYVRIEHNKFLLRLWLAGPGKFRLGLIQPRQAPSGLDKFEIYNGLLVFGDRRSSNLYNSRATVNRLKKFRLRSEYKPLVRYFKPNDLPLNSLYLSGSDYFFNPSGSNLMSFIYYSNDANVESLDNNYENIKNLKHLYHSNNKSTYLSNTSSFKPFSYSTVLDYFRADFDENS
jgi:hypothetical protein